MLTWPDPAQAQTTNTGVSLVAWWDFNSTNQPDQSVDKVKGYIATFENSPLYTTNAGGRSGLTGDCGLDFGVDAVARAARCVDLVDDLNSAAATDQLTISFWQKWNTTTASSSTFWFTSPSSSGTQRGIQAHVPYGGSTMYYDSAGCCTAPTQRLSGSPATGFNWQAWHHFAFVKNGGIKEIWIDGTVVLQQASGADPLPTDFSEIIIGYGLGGGNSVLAVLDDFAIFKGALDSTAIKSLASGKSPVQVMDLYGDNDGDGMPNGWEDKYGFDKNSAADAALDADNDGLTNLQEFKKGTDPKNADTDGDGLKDGVETGTGTWVSASDTGTNPLKADTDSDGLLDGVETNTGVFVDKNNTGTNPVLRDTDNDGYADGVELLIGTNPLDASSFPNLGTGARLIAYWDFNDATVATQAVDKARSLVGVFTNGVVYTADKGGRSGKAGDRSVDFGTAVANRGIRSQAVAPWLQAAARDDKMTVSFWQRWSVAPGNNSAFWMVSPSSSGNFRGFQAHAPNGGQIYYDTAGCCTAGTQRINGTPPGIDWMKWHNFVFVKDGTTKQIWIDGILFLEGTTASPLPTDISMLVIGNDVDVAASQHRGTIDDFAVFASALNVDQITALSFGVPANLLDTGIGDNDKDGLPNWYEDMYGLNKNDAADANQDADADGVTNFQEFQYWTDPKNPDSDFDGLNDGAELAKGTDPLKPDTDGDGLLDGVETDTGRFVSITDTGTSPLLADSDSDGYPDSTEISLGSNPTDANSVPLQTGEANLLAYWDFNDTTVSTQAVDKVHGYVGTLKGVAAYTGGQGGRSLGITDRGVNFGTAAGNQMIQVSNAFWLGATSPNDQITVSFWQKWNVAVAANFAFFGYAPSATGQRGISAHAPWSDSVIYWDTGGTTANSSRISANINTFSNNIPGGFISATAFFTNWHHYAFVKDDLIKQIWIDGKLFLEAENSANLASDFSQLFIGNDNTGANGSRAVIDDFAIYASALDEAKITALAQGASPISFVLPPAKAVITTQPQGQTISPGSSVTFTAAAQGDGPLLYQWRRNGVDLAGQTNTTLTLTNVQWTQAGDYVVNVSNPGGGNYSTPATLVVTAPPQIAAQPRNVFAPAGTTVAFSVTAQGPTPFTYQWKLNGADLAGATNATLSLTNIQAAGDYTVVVANPFGTNLSTAAKLTLIGQNPGFALISSFASEQAGALNGQNGWAANGATVVADPANPANLVANFATTANVGNTLSLVIPTGKIATLSFRLRVEVDNSDTNQQVLNWSVGMADQITGTVGGEFADYQYQINQNRDAGNNLPKQIRARDGGAFASLADLNPQVWYRFWMVINHAVGNMQVYAQGGQFATQTQLLDSTGKGTFALRNSTRLTNDIKFFFARSSNNGTPVYVDDIYLDLSGQNLTEPVAESKTPTLAIKRNGSSIVISWPTADGTGFTLNSAGSLAKPINWQPVTGTLGTDGAMTTLTLPSATGTKFYILKK